MRNLYATGAELKVYCCQAHSKNALTIRLLQKMPKTHWVVARAWHQQEQSTTTIKIKNQTKNCHRLAKIPLSQKKENWHSGNLRCGTSQKIQKRNQGIDIHKKGINTGKEKKGPHTLWPHCKKIQKRNWDRASASVHKNSINFGAHDNF